MQNFYNTIVIGSGLAGLNLARRATKYGTVLIITKGKLFESNSWLAQGGIAAVFSDQDTFEKHIEDTMKAGAFHNDQEIVEEIIKAAPAIIKKLQTLGIKFNQTKQKLNLHREGGHSENRIIHNGDRTGQSIQTVLVDLIKKNPKIDYLENALVYKLLVSQKKCFGISMIKNKQTHNLFANSIVLATGGVGQVYERTTNPKLTTGDGIALAYEAGCKLKDLEFIQFHPTALKSKTSPLFLLSEALRGAGAKIINNKGIRFMAKVHPLAELAPRDIVARAIFEEEKYHQVFLDLRHIPTKKLLAEFPQITTHLKKIGINPKNDLLPITPAAHYLCGGIQATVEGKTNIENLYAIGEVACTGLHGANRLASNSLLEAAVMSFYWKPVFKKSKLPSPIFPLQVYQNLKSPKIQMHTQNLIKKLMWQNVAIVRDKNHIKAAYKKLAPLQAKTQKQINEPSLQTHLMFTTAKLITKAAIKRKKSLGTHFVI